MVQMKSLADNNRTEDHHDPCRLSLAQKKQLFSGASNCSTRPLMKAVPVMSKKINQKNNSTESTSLFCSSSSSSASSVRDEERDSCEDLSPSKSRPRDNEIAKDSSTKSRMETGTDVKPLNSSLADRLRALQSDQQKWRSRLRKSPEPTVTLRTSGISNRTAENVPIRERPNSICADVLPVKGRLAERLSLLQESSKAWMSRVEEKDTKKFTVAGKLEQKNLSQTPNKLTQETKLRRKSFASLDVLNDSNNVYEEKKSPLITCVARQKENHEHDLNKQKRHRAMSVDAPKSKWSPLQEENKEKLLVHENRVLMEEQKVSSESLDTIQVDKGDLLIIRKNIPKQTRRAASKRFVKSLAASSSIPDSPKPASKFPDISYKTPTSSFGVFDPQLRSKSTSASARPRLSEYRSSVEKDIHSRLAASARAGLASTEDFTAVASRLRKCSNPIEHLDSSNLTFETPRNKANLQHQNSGSSQDTDLAETPRTNPVLLQVKGRRRTQVRAVPPVPSSMNHGDCYILLTSDYVFVWLGEFANVIERNKALELGERLYERRELGFLGGKYALLDLERADGVSAGQLGAFATALGIDGGLVALDAQICCAGDPDEDEQYEKEILLRNRVYAVDFALNRTREMDEYKGRVPSQKWLKSEKALIFDFYEELYVWLGSRLDSGQRTMAIRLARQLFVQYERPKHALFYKCNQNMEQQLFREKFADWSTLRLPEISTLISNAISASGGPTCLTPNMEAKKLALTIDFDVKDMFQPLPDADLVLEDTHLGRGDCYHDDSELLHTEIVTENVRCWHVNECEQREVFENDFGQFFDTENYVLRWQYVVNRVGRELNLQKFPFMKFQEGDEPVEYVQKRRTSENEKSVTGRERCCYFYWQGSNCSVNSRGAAALLANELDKEKCPQVQITQSKELPAFLRLFNSRLVLYHCEPGECVPHSQRAATGRLRGKRLFLIRGVFKEECMITEVTLELASLRSRGCFIALDISSNRVWLWIGCQSTQEQTQIAEHALEIAVNHHKFSELCKKAITFTVHRILEGEEPISFWRLFGEHVSVQERRAIYSSALDSKQGPSEEEPKLFHLTSMTGQFHFKRISCPYSAPGKVNAFPFEQQELYTVSQPAFFLLHVNDVVYLWQGWFPELTGTLVAGSAMVRYTQEKKCALETAISYTHNVNPKKPPKAYLIYAGLEPNEFTLLFPQWQVNEEARESQIKDGKHQNEMVIVQEVLAKVCNLNNVYKLEDLRKRPLPDGINPLCIETYLSDDEFRCVLGMDRDQFYALPSWKQYTLKQKGGLF